MTICAKRRDAEIVAEHTSYKVPSTQCVGFLCCNSLMQELHTWIQQLPSQLDKCPMTCTAADILGYMDSHWTKAYPGTHLADGTCIASPAGDNVLMTLDGWRFAGMHACR